MNCTITKITSEETLEIRHAVLWPLKPVAFVRLEEDGNGIHFGFWKNTQLIAVISLFITDNEAQFRKFATIDTEQGNGYGSLLLKHVLDYTKQKQLKKVWCNARVDKANFYERFGMHTTTETFEKSGVDYVVMQKI